MARPTESIIDLDALAHNLRLIRRLVGSDCAIMPAVKADAYGHGAVPVSLALEQQGCDWLSVATVEEGIELREAGVSLPILLLGYVPEEDFDAVIRFRLTPSLIEVRQAVQLNDAARRQGTRLDVHVNVDTGMHRLGLDWEHAAAAIRGATELAHLRVSGVWTHFARAEDRDMLFCREQFRRFLGVKAQLEAQGRQLLYHTCNSAGCLRLPEAHCGGVRPGIILYGVKPACAVEDPIALRPLLSLRTQIVSIKPVRKGDGIGYGHSFTAQRDSLIATLPVGYHDGYIRQYSNRGFVLVRGRKAPVVGRVCMDQCMIDVTDIPKVRLRDQVVIYGEQDGARIEIGERAASTETIPHVITCAISRRVPRRFRMGGADVTVQDLQHALRSSAQRPDRLEA